MGAPNTPQGTAEAGGEEEGDIEAEASMDDERSGAEDTGRQEPADVQVREAAHVHDAAEAPAEKPAPAPAPDAPDHES